MNVNRRNCIAAFAGMTNLRPLGAVDFDEPVPGSENLTAYENSGQILVRWRNETLSAYRAHAEQKYPYFHPMAGPLSGLPLTSESALPYPHQRGLWLGWEPVNGGDYWTDETLEKGQIRSTGLKLDTVRPTSAVFSDSCEWVRKGAPSPLRDTRLFTITVVNERLWTLDAEFRITALEDVTIKSAKHSLFALRCAADLAPIYGGQIVNSAGGLGAAGTYGKKANWCGFFGRRAKGEHPIEGITILDHPQNPWSPCPWMTRDYGNLSPSPFNFLEKPWTLGKGEMLHLRYRVAAHAGDPKEAGIEGLWRKWSS